MCVNMFKYCTLVPLCMSKQYITRRNVWTYCHSLIYCLLLSRPLLLCVYSLRAATEKTMMMKHRRWKASKWENGLLLLQYILRAFCRRCLFVVHLTFFIVMFFIAIIIMQRNQLYWHYNYIPWAKWSRTNLSAAQEKEMEKQKLLYQQARLHRRGASEMVLQTISSSKGTERKCSILMNDL